MALCSRYVEMVLCLALIFSEQPLTQYCSTLGIFKHVLVCSNYQAWGMDAKTVQKESRVMFEKNMFYCNEKKILKIFKWFFFFFYFMNRGNKYKRKIFFPSASWSLTQRHRFVTSFGYYQKPLMFWRWVVIKILFYKNIYIDCFILCFRYEWHGLLMANVFRKV